MKRVTLRFKNLQILSECMFQVNITNPEINYENYTLKADLTDKQIVEALDCGAEIIDEVIVR